MQCDNRSAQSEGEKHRHADATRGRATKCQVYPKQFCRAVCVGIAAQNRLRNLGLTALTLMSPSAMAAIGAPSEDLHENYYFEAYDDLTGAELDPALMEEARREEIRDQACARVEPGSHTRRSFHRRNVGSIKVRSERKSQTNGT